MQLNKIDNSILLEYSGEFNSTNLFESLDVILCNRGVPKQIQKKLLSIASECIEQGSSRALQRKKFTLIEVDHSFNIELTFQIPPKAVSWYRNNLNKVNSLDHNERRIWFKQILRTQNLSYEDIKTLSIIDLCKTARSQINYEIESFGTYSTISLQIKIFKDYE